MAAIALAVIGVLMMQSHVRKEKQAYRRSLEREMICVLVAESSISEGEEIRSDDLSFRQVTKEEQPWSTIKISDPERDLGAKRQYEDLLATLTGRTVSRAVPTGDFLLWTDIVQEDRKALGDALESNQRGVAVQVDPGSVLSGLLQPNDRVDVLATYETGIVVSGSEADRWRGNVRVNKTVVVLEDVAVMAVGNKMARDIKPTQVSTRGISVVLALDPDQALVLSHVHKEAKISLLLRARGQTDTVGYDETQGVVTSEDIEDMVDVFSGKRRKEGEVTR